MRKALIGILMGATMATPMAAAAQTSDTQAESPRVQRALERYQRIEQRNQQRTERRQERQAERTERRQERQADRVERRQDRSAERHDQRRERPRTERRDGTPLTTGWTGSRSDPRQRDDMNRYERQARENALRHGTREQRREIRQEDRENRREWRRDRREDRREWRDDRRDRRTWNREWRRDQRYDWQRWRQYNRDVFNVGRYYSPYRDHRYSRFSIGLRIGSGFYGDRYWIRDPWQYRLPPAYAGTRWIRYYDDVLLVDMYTGQVIDVIYNFFW